MEQREQEEGDLRLYLLGLLPQERQEPLEERLFTEAGLYEELLIFEDELIDQYLAGGLTERDRGAFESHFMNSPERRRQMLFANALTAYIADKGAISGRARNVRSGKFDQGAERNKESRSLLSWLPVRKPALAFSLIVAAVVLVGGISWMAVSSLRPKVSRQVLTVLITPGGQTRAGGDVQKVLIPSGTEAMQLQLRLATVEFQSYRVTLLTGNGAPVLTAERLKPVPSDSGLVLVVTVPARQALPGEYQLKLNGVNADGTSENVDSYRFRIVDR
ncbi:MAG: hypothetical protein M3410_04315 [Acidobacteriota bacterium]|nr:hypothetical protein [Acidobacteriota bacterium]